MGNTTSSITLKLLIITQIVVILKMLYVWANDELYLKFLRLFYMLCCQSLRKEDVFLYFTIGFGVDSFERLDNGLLGHDA